MACRGIDFPLSPSLGVDDHRFKGEVVVSRGLCMRAPMQVQVLGEMMNPNRLWKVDYRPHDYRSSRRGTFAAQCQMTFFSIAVELDARRVWKCSGLQPPCRSCFDRSSFGEIPKRSRIGSRFAGRREGSCRCGLPGREVESRTPPAQMPRRCCWRTSLKN